MNDSLNVWKYTMYTQNELKSGTFPGSSAGIECLTTENRSGDKEKKANTIGREETLQ